jgi:hypothetical protein
VVFQRRWNEIMSTLIWLYRLHWVLQLMVASHLLLMRTNLDCSATHSFIYFLLGPRYIFIILYLQYMKWLFGSCHFLLVLSRTTSHSWPWEGETWAHFGGGGVREFLPFSLASNGDCGSVSIVVLWKWCLSMQQQLFPEQ